jgi:predicted dienelactone hydrolase
LKNLKVTLCLLIAFFPCLTIAAVNVGIAKLDLNDGQRMAWDGKHQRPITVHVFYPTHDTPPTPIKLGLPGEELFAAGNAIGHATPAEEKKLPLILMSHGTGGSALQMLWLAEKLVKNGYLVVGINHHGNTAIEPKTYAEGFVLWWERSRDVAVVLEQISNDKKWSPYIDPTNIGMLGFSLGGYTTIAAIGGITDKARFTKFCNSDKRDFTCDSQVEFPNIEEEFNKVKDSEIVKASLKRQHDSYKIDQIKAAVVLSPAVVQSITDDSLKGITVPVSVIVGTQDTVAPAAANAKRVASLVSGAEYAEIEGAGHYTFLAECTDLGKVYVKTLCTDPPKVDRAQVHDSVSGQVLSFFNRTFSYNKELHQTGR